MDYTQAKGKKLNLLDLILNRHLATYLEKFFSSVLYEQLFQVIAEHFMELSHQRLDVLRRTRFPFLSKILLNLRIGERQTGKKKKYFK